MIPSMISRILSLGFFGLLHNPLLLSGDMHFPPVVHSASSPHVYLSRSLADQPTTFSTNLLFFGLPAYTHTYVRTQSCYAALQLYRIRKKKKGHTQHLVYLLCLSVLGLFCLNRATRCGDNSRINQAKLFRRQQHQLFENNHSSPKMWCCLP